MTRQTRTPEPTQTEPDAQTRFPYGRTRNPDTLERSYIRGACNRHCRAQGVNPRRQQHLSEYLCDMTERFRDRKSLALLIGGIDKPLPATFRAWAEVCATYQARIINR